MRAPVGTAALAAVAALGLIAAATTPIVARRQAEQKIGGERAVPRHLRDGDEFKLSPGELVAFGRRLFEANWTIEDGAGRPRSKGDGRGLSDPSQPLVSARGFNRISGPDANSCQGCHNMPHGISGGSGDVVTSAFEQAERFDFVTFDPGDPKPLRGAAAERSAPATLQTVGNLRSTRGLFGAGYLEMLARQMTGDLQAIRDRLQPGQSAALAAKGVSFGTLARRANGSWDVAGVQGLPASSVATRTGTPSLVVRPWMQAGEAVSLREVTNDSFNRHHGIQTTERFGVGTDPDGDGVVNEMTRADVTAVAVFLAAMPVPGRVIPNDPDVEAAVMKGEELFDRIRCTACHVASLPLARGGWIYSEPNPYNPSGNLRPPAKAAAIDLTRDDLPGPRLAAPAGEAPLAVPAYTDFKLHDIGQLEGTAESRSDGRFLTRRLWGVGNQPPYFHHGLFTTMRRAILEHAGEALSQRTAFEQLETRDQDALVEFLKSLQVLPAGTKSVVVDERYRPRTWPPARGHSSGR